MNFLSNLPASVLTGLAILLLYLPVIAFVFRMLFPQPTVGARGMLMGLLAAQALVIGLKVFYRPENDFIRWVLTSGWEFNVPAAFGATLMLTASVVALLSAWLSPKESALKRIYLIMIAAGFCLMMLEEHFKFYRSNMPAGQSEFLGPVVVGLPLILAIFVSALRSEKKARVWDFSLLAGLLLTAVAAIVVDNLPKPCSILGAPLTNGCLVMTTIEESLEMLGVWLALAALLGKLSEIAPLPAPRLRTGLRIAPIALFSLLMLHIVIVDRGYDELRHMPHRLAMRLEVASLDQPAAIQFEGGVEIQGYVVTKEADRLSIQIYSSSAKSENRGSGYSAHLVDQASKASVAGIDKSWCCPSRIPVYGPVCDSRCEAQRIFPDWLLNEPLYRQRMEIKLEPGALTNRALWIVLTYWSEGRDNFIYQSVLASDLPLLSDTQVILDELVLPAESAPAASPPTAKFSNGFVLESANLPQRAKAGETLSLRFAWRSDAAGMEDHIQFLHLGHEASGKWRVYDKQPLGPRLPTRLWYQGLADSETWLVPLPADLAPGSYAVYTGLYRMRDSERIPVTDADGLPWLDARLLLGSLIIE